MQNDIVEITGLVNFFKAVPDPFIRNQVQGITIAVLEMLVRVPGPLPHLGPRGNTSPPFLDSVINLANEVRRELSS